MGWWLIASVVLVIPFWTILPRHGLPAWAALLCFIPLGAIIQLWIVAFKDRFEGGAA